MLLEFPYLSIFPTRIDNKQSVVTWPLLSIQDSRHGLDEDGHAEATNTGPFRFGLLILSEQSSVDANRFPRVDNPIGRRCERNGH